MDRLAAAFGVLPMSANGVQAATSAEIAKYGDLALLYHVGGGYASRTGERVTETSAMRNATFNRAVTLISSSIGMLPFNLMVRNGDEIEKARDHQAWRLMRERPNPLHTPYQFKAYMQGRALLKGNAYAQKVPGVRGTQALWPLDPDLVTLELSRDMTPRYRYRPKKGEERTFKVDEIFHLRSPWSSDGINGDGWLKLAVDALGLADLTDESAARLLKNGAYVGGVLEHPGNLSPEAIKSLRAQFNEKFVGPENAGKWMVAEEGMKAKPLGATGKDAEGLGHRKHQSEEIARFTGVPRPLLAFDETSWGSGIEQLGLFFVTYCLLPWFNAWEEAAAKALLSDTERADHYFKFNEGALLRGSLKDQAEFLSKAIGGPGQGGWMVPDEAREKMDMNPMPDGAGTNPAWQMESESNAE